MHKEDPIIQVKHLSKRYQIGMDRTYKTFCETAVDTIKSPLKRLKSFSRQEEVFWALKDVNFEVYPGEVVGIIGRNGAGKSTLLKILSRITHPTEGEITLRGRVASLLEVGTGFHPELTGRENVYFNGAILGMTKQEIEDKFDEIVAFSGVADFLDTPLKRYSSGMQVRLAFAVAAHLEPEILLVDEVLAVGDAEFQKKCLNKMEEVALGGRTILFVSHNMAAIESLCSRAIILENGKNIFDDNVSEAIAQYLNTSKQLAKLPLNKRADRTGNGVFKIVDCIIGIEGNRECGYWQTGKDCLIQFKYKTDLSIINSIDIGFEFFDLRGKSVFSANTIVLKKRINPKKDRGVIVCKIEKFPISPGQYSISYDTYDGNVLLDKLENAILVTVENGDFYGTGVLWGGYSTVSTEYEWCGE